MTTHANERFELSIRAPTSTAWMVSAATIIITGELYYEIQRSGIATLFGRPFTDGELWPPVILGALIAAASVAWLVSLYVAPGTLIIDGAENQVLRRVRRRVSAATYAGPLAQWRVHFTFFSRDTEKQRIFKRLEMSGPGWSEVVLFTDVARGEDLVEALEQVREALGAYEVKIISDLDAG